ncbi:TPA_asm: hypothetical protein CBHJFHIM_00017 [Methanobrevibacter gottschalkii virus vir075]|uniref:Uncharacterized protein n=1 Tax=Methanobrevibacter gottschalkii TaxID=190974 RepID=A0A1H7I7C3_9EURY|nr:hypothetical protein [Methanobrevibacter gottschalkii]SEK57712.1 hypothetical protein SAMN05216439_1151 [Methanobrevibacter gottschalkii]
MRMVFNIDVSNNNLINHFITELKDVKKLIETNDNVNFYLNVRFSKDKMETLDLSRFATIKICEDGFACYSLQTHSSSFIYFDKIVGLELVESKINERIIRS